MEFCEFKDAKKGTVCSRCGYSLLKNYKSIPSRTCTTAPGPGTRLKGFLEQHGITEEWYRGMKEKVGLLPDCNCEMRRRLLDETWAAWKTGGWRAAKIAYNQVKAYYDKPI